MNPKTPIPFLNNMNAETFIRDYWQKKPLLVRNAFSDLDQLIDANELAGLSLEEPVESRLIQYHPERDEWQLTHGPFTEAIFHQLPGQHWTLLVQAVDQWVPELSRFLDQFQFVPSWRIDDLMISYAADQGSVGPHFDQYDVFLIQARGQRRWHIGTAVPDNVECLPHPDLKLLQDMPVEHDYVVQPGDLLYLPPKVAHHGVAKGDDCMTFSVGFRAPDLKQVLREYSEHIIEQQCADTLWRDPDLTPQSEPAWLNPETVSRLHQKLSALMSNTDHFENWLAGYLSAPKYANAEPEPFDQSPPLDQAQPSYRDESVRIVLRGANPERPRDMYANGQRFSLDDGNTPLARLFSRQRVFNTSELLKLAESESALQLLQELAKLGYIYQPE